MNLLGAFILAQALDAGSTCVALNRGFVEANPLMPQTCAKGVAVKGLTLSLAASLPKSKGRTVLLIAGTVAGASATAWNLYQMRRP